MTGRLKSEFGTNGVPTRVHTSTSTGNAFGAIYGALWLTIDAVKNRKS